MEYDHDGEDTALTDDDRYEIEEEIRCIDFELERACNAPDWVREVSFRRRHLQAELAAGRRLPMEEAQEYYDYSIVRRADEIGGGWQLRLLEDGKEVGGGVFSVTRDDAGAAAWWAKESDLAKQFWERRTKGGTPEDAYFEHLHDEAWHDATGAAGEWLDTRPAR